MDDKKKKTPKKSMDDLFNEYLASLSDIEAERRYWSFRKYAKTVFDDFQNWLVKVKDEQSHR
jgi:hypothetical protein